MKTEKTTIELPKDLLNEAKGISGVKTKTQAIVLALEEFIQRRKARKILELQGTVDVAFNYKTARLKR